MLELPPGTSVTESWGCELCDLALSGTTAAATHAAETFHAVRSTVSVTRVFEPIEIYMKWSSGNADMHLP